MSFPQEILSQQLLKKAGSKLTFTSKSVSEAVTNQIEQIKQNIKSFYEINQNLVSIKQYIDNAAGNMDETTKVTQLSSQNLDTVSQKMKELESKFESINDLLKTINTIADQTNLLALNATIEAARAGEFGRGFAVVANEVKELSHTTKRSNEEIQETLGSIGQAINLLAQAVQSTKEQMSKTLELVHASEKNISQIHSQTDSFSIQVNHSLTSFQTLEESSGQVENEIHELGTIGGTFTSMLELMSRQGLFKSTFHPLDRLQPFVDQSKFHEPERFSSNEKEILLNDEDILISATDARGVIQFANNKFYEIAEYEFGSLKNKAHNIIRHPDMPKTAFADLWETIKKGEIWQGIVLNRSKSGKIYWVNAITFPSFSNNQIIGYISVRSRPDRKDIERAKDLYRKLE